MGTVTKIQNQAQVGGTTPSFGRGLIDGHYGALLLKGKVGVRNRAGAVTLSVPGQGTYTTEPPEIGIDPSALNHRGQELGAWHAAVLARPWNYPTQPR